MSTRKSQLGRQALSIPSFSETLQPETGARQGRGHLAPITHPTNKTKEIPATLDHLLCG